MTARTLSPGGLWAVLAVVFGLVAVSVSPGYFNLDEIVYAMAADAVARSGGLAIDNGFERFGSDAFRIWFLHPGPHGLASQYPVGSAFAGALLAPVFGQKALIVLNGAAAVGTLVLTRVLARSLLRSEPAATLAAALVALFSFWPEYVFGHWPHSVSVFCTTLALVLFLRALPRETGAYAPAVWSGLAIGAGMLFRLDGILLAPAIAVITLLWAARPLGVLAGGAVGLAPMIALLAASNHARFASWNPLSYGMSGGGTDLSGHAGTILLMLVAGAGLVAVRHLPPAGPRARAVLAGTAAIGLGAALLSPLAPYVWRLLDGVRTIVFDATAIDDPRPGVVRQPDGTLLFWGLPKKALLQSLPWLGVLGFLAGGGRGAPARAVPIVLIVSAVWALPFVALSWHGGLGSNMRYLLPILPPLAALSAWTILRVGETVADAPRLLLAGVLVALALAVILRAVAPETGARMHQVYPNWLFAAIFGLSLAAGLVARPPLQKAALIATGAGLGLSLYLAASDFAAAQARRAANDASARATATIPGPVIFNGPPELYANAIGDPERLLALAAPAGGDGALDPDALRAACTAGFRIVMSPGMARATGLPGVRFAPLADPGLAAAPPLVEVICE